VLFGALVVFRRLDEVGETDPTGSGLVVGRFGSRATTGPVGRGVAIVTTIALVLAPLVLSGVDLRQAHRFIALAVIFISIVAITGFSGHLTLGQASIAGLGAFATARAANTWDLPVLVAMVFGAAVAAAAGFLAGYPPLRRRGLFLGLTTLGLALLIDRFIFNEQLFVGGPGGLEVTRPVLFGIDLGGDVAFYFYELVLLGIVLALAHNLRSGRLGRVLGAMRDSEVAAQSVGIELRRAKLFVFGVSSAMAGIGGAMLTQANQAWDPFTFNPVIGLFWFTAVVVCGLSSTRGAMLAAFLFIFIPHVLDLDIRSAVGLFGIGAVFVGALRGGIVGQVHRAGLLIRHKVAEQYLAARRPAPEPPPEPVPSAFAERVLAERGLR
jgi:branched-chain amino acid transport system permease protein